MHRAVCKWVPYPALPNPPLTLRCLIHPLPRSLPLPGGLLPSDFSRQPAVPQPDSAGADAADVGRQEHDVRCRPAPRPLPHCLCTVPRPHVLQGGDDSLGLGGRAARQGRQAGSVKRLAAPHDRCPTLQSPVWPALLCHPAGGGRADAECAEQEQQLLCGVDPQQCEPAG